ncbi:MULTISPECIES: branched-chain amino acid ABC transporter permease [unclassified Chelatococcus]|uniref:branched-chain amino acid ABC transporter permease n=1 Tax=unclassified Chelatococcus TaxID=2638111 RepID=UPI001BCCE2B2|nr:MULTISPECIES: branched-chain amino acid ABC transporter permease [unclassified Chelatococcus]CAH1661359.1 Branched-chain amino acid transport system permease protein [Hyphomicrobiales bacterium]MBS7696440.1 branched-chain amino acid ABC transporter permease [Chelatococcus sp. YT9]MBS7741243.1 branched-chain amino acid ABC transporter permease [Chelatococcus sp. HY11]MBX3546275.1 branched-chain amino acid ABC transporter permease [Chelatococcus sp.]MBX3557050.1 branched-chain amino acid ABC 
MDAVLQALINGIISGTLLAVPALGFSAIFAVLRFPNFAIGALATAGAYCAWVVNVSLGLPIPVAIFAAFVGAGLAGALLEYGALERLGRGGALMKAIGSLAMGMVIENIVRFIFGNDLQAFDLPLARDIVFGPIRVGPQQLNNLVLALVIMAAVWAFLSLTSLGRSMRAVADNPDLARLKGVNPRFIALVTVAIGSGLCGIGGTLIGLDTAIDPLVGGRVLLSVFAAAVLGGLGSIPGAVAGAFLIGIVEEFTVLALSPAYRLAVGFIVILVVLTVRPSGLLGSKAN